MVNKNSGAGDERPCGQSPSPLCEHGQGARVRNRRYNRVASSGKCPSIFCSDDPFEHSISGLGVVARYLNADRVVNI